MRRVRPISWWMRTIWKSRFRMTPLTTLRRWNRLASKTHRLKRCHRSKSPSSIWMNPLRLHPLSRSRGPREKSGIKPVATMYSKEESYKVIQAREAGSMEPLNKLMTPRTLVALHRTSVAVQFPAQAPVPPPKPGKRTGSSRRGRN
nr:uncharacterized protein LOC118878243 isoform X1 [Drosophila suzukii]